MNKKLWIMALFCLLANLAWAQHDLRVLVVGQDSGNALQGASVKINGTKQTMLTDQDGVAIFKDLRAGNYDLLVSFLGYEAAGKQLALHSDQEVEIRLHQLVFLTEEVIVNATRASENSATTYKNLSKAELAKNNLGQDLPYLLDQTPGVIVSSDAGAGVGYTGIRIRGSDPTRVNVTINGIPLNNPESMGTFLVNLPDFASSVDNIQLQRGVGTSTNGAGAFGGSLNIQTTSLNAEPYAELDNSFGSYNTLKNTIRLGSGLLNNQFTFDGRLSQIKSDGYIDRAFSNLRSYFLTGAWHGEKSLLRANVFSGKEQTYQAWNGVPEEMLDINRRYNEFTYKDQTDNYTQTHYQLHFSHALSTSLHFNAALHYTRGAGYYEEYKENQEFEKYGLTNVEIGNETISSTDLIRRRWLDNHFYGTTYSLTYVPNSQLEFSLGGAYNEYLGGHYGEVIWAKFASNSNLGDRYYEDDATKKDFNVFGKATYRLDRFSLYADLQYRHVAYKFLGYDRNLIQLDQVDYLNFFNPKFGVTYKLADQQSLYASFAIANKEPIRDDYVESSVLSRPSPERMNNLEAGYRVQAKTYQLGANVYGMFYKDQLITTGEINDVGEIIRQNVPDSYRMGLELDGKWQPVKKFSWALTAALSENRITNFTEFVDLYDYSGAQEFTYDKTYIAFSPAFVGSSELTYRVFEDVELSLISKYVSRQYLDNTSSVERSLDAFFVNNVRVGYQFKAKGVKQVGVSLLINNILNEKYSSNGYTWGHLNQDGSRAHYNYYYPQATANFLIGLSLKF